MKTTDSCGSINTSNSEKRRTLTTAFTPGSTGPVLLEFNNWRNGNDIDPIVNYIDNFSFRPMNPDFAASIHDISIFTGGVSNFSLDAGLGLANRDFLIFSGVTGTWPGTTLGGNHLPLNLDGWTWTAFSLVNTSIMSNFMGSLDGTGKASAAFDTLGSLPIDAVGLAFYFDYILLNPIDYTSHPIYVLMTW